MGNGIIEEFMEQIQDIRFENIDELYSRRKEIKKKYSEKSKDVKEIYKWYFFYQLCIVKKLEIKRLLWYFINDESTDAKLCSDLCKEYRNFCKKRFQIIKNQNR